MTAVAQAAANIRRWREKPPVFVREVFGVEPDPWQDDVLEAFPHQQRIAMCASKGPGKTAVESWIAWNFLSTRPHPKVAATSITADNLRDNLWTEMAKWQAKSPFLKAAFEWGKERIVARDHPETWWMSARTWPRNADPQQQADTLAGLHADYVLFLLDESGGIPDAVMASAEAALSTGIEAHIVQAGNPTMREGPLYRACTLERRLWHIIEINGDPDNPRRSPRVSIQWAREQIEKYGRENPWVLVNVFGRFPPSSINSLISIEDMTAATRRAYGERDIAQAARILGCDVARFGDDSNVVFPRQGLVLFDPMQCRNVDGPTGAGWIARKWRDWEADACFIDDTGGWGATWIDSLRELGRTPIPVGFASEPHDHRYYNKRAEIYFDAAEWVKSGGQIPNVPELIAAMTRTTYTFKGDRLLIEPKDVVKEKLGYSPDHADAFVTTFAQPIVSKKRRPVSSARDGDNYDPFREVNESGRYAPAAHGRR